MSATAPSPERFLRRDKPHTAPLLEPPLPQAFDAEVVVIGNILTNNGLAIAREQLKPEYFFGVDHQRIFGGLVEMGDAGLAIDLVGLCDYLHRKGELESVGGATYVAQLVDVQKTRDLEFYIRPIRAASLARRAIYVFATLQAQLLNGEDVGLLLPRAAQDVAQLQAGQSAPGEDFRQIFHDFADFENSSALTFAIEGFLQNDAATMIGGLSGHGKTFVLLSIVKALLAGKGTRLWDSFTVKETAVRCLYLIPESSLPPFKHRLQLFELYDYLRPEDGRLLVRTLSKGPTPCLSDPRILFAAKGAHVFLDTAVRFAEHGDENSASDNQRGLATDIFALLASGARSVVAAHHAPKPFLKENVMRLENVLRGSGDVGAMLATCWAIKQLDAARNVVHIECVKSRDFSAVGSFQLAGRPFIDETGDFRIHKRPGECGSLMEEQEPNRDQGGAPVESRQERRERVALVRNWLNEDPSQTIEQLRSRFDRAGVKVSPSAVKNYRREALDVDTDTN